MKSLARNVGWLQHRAHREVEGDWEASLRPGRQVEISPSFARLGCWDVGRAGGAREDEQFFLLSHSNRKTGQAQQRLERPGRGLFDISGGNHFIMTVRFPNLSSQLLIPLHLHNIYNPPGKEITDFSITQIVGILPSKIHN